MDWVTDKATAETLLLQYSEWLDGEGVVKTVEECGDTRTHGELVEAFLMDRNPDSRPRVTEAWQE